MVFSQCNVLTVSSTKLMPFSPGPTSLNSYVWWNGLVNKWGNYWTYFLRLNISIMCVVCWWVYSDEIFIVVDIKCSAYPIIHLCYPRLFNIPSDNRVIVPSSVKQPRERVVCKSGQDLARNLAKSCDMIITAWSIEPRIKTPAGNRYCNHISNKHIHPFGIINPQNHCYMNSVIQLLFSILRTISQNFQFNSSTEGSISKFLFEIACSASSSTDVDVLKFRLVQYDKFYSGEQQDASECLMMLIELINKVSVQYCGSNDNNFSIWNLIFIYVRKIYCLQCMWTEIPLIWV